MKLTPYEESVLNGLHGRLVQVALENIIRYADVLGATELCEVTKATVFCGAHHYLNFCNTDNFHELFTKMNLGKDEIIPFNQTYPNCYTQSCVSPCDQFSFDSLHQSKKYFDKNTSYLEECRKAGVTIAGSCAPYLTGWLPVKGEHFVTTESGVTAIGNSLWGAMGNSDGIEAAFWSSICGRTPLWGNHIEENRKATHHVVVEANIDHLIEWDLLGKAVGMKLPSSSIPVVDGHFKSVNFTKLAQFFTTILMSSNCELCHVSGITPEARDVSDAFKGSPSHGDWVVTNKDLQYAYDLMCDEGAQSVDFVSLGCPHYNIDLIKKAAEYIEGKKINPNVHFMIWTVYPIKAMADLNGYTRIIEEAGGKIYTSSCPTTVGNIFLDHYSGFVFDSYKQARSVKSDTDKPVFYGDMKTCIDVAVSGRWEVENRWKR
jgi:cis-L-3-hydroxyproline dehydratase